MGVLSAETGHSGPIRGHTTDSDTCECRGCWKALTKHRDLVSQSLLLTSGGRRKVVNDRGNRHERNRIRTVSKLLSAVSGKAEKITCCPDCCGSGGWALSCEQKVAGSIPSQGTCLVVGPVLVGACARGNRLIFLSHIHVSLPLFLPPFPSK